MKEFLTSIIVTFVVMLGLFLVIAGLIVPVHFISISNIQPIWRLIFSILYGIAWISLIFTIYIIEDNEY